MVKNSFEMNIRLFIFYIISINYVTQMDQSLIFEPSWVQNTIFALVFYLAIPSLWAHVLLSLGSFNKFLVHIQD